MSCVYWFVVVFVDSYYQIKFISMASGWPHGTPCSLLAILSAISSYLHIFITLLVNVQRALGVIYPLRTIRSIHVYYTTAIIWTLTSASVMMYFISMKYIYSSEHTILNRLCFALLPANSHVHVFTSLCGLRFVLLQSCIMSFIIYLMWRTFIAVEQSRRAARGNIMTVNTVTKRI